MANFKDLPCDTIYEILTLLNSHYNSNFCQYVLICKDWFYPAQILLYSEAKFRSLHRLECFQRTVESNLDLGKKVKKLTLLRIPDPDIKRLDMLSNLLNDNLPNLEELEIHTLYSYIPILNALENSQLKHLKKISPPEGEALSEESDYTTCILYSKDRIESIRLFDRLQETNGQLPNPCFHRLYNRIHQFPKLKEIDIHKYTSEEIQEFEHIVENCKSLNTIIIKCSPLDSQPHNRSISKEEISTFMPAYHINKVECTVNVTNDYKILLYLMHKFPSLRYFSFLSKYSTRSSINLDYDLLIRFLSYLDSCYRYDIYDLRVDWSTFTKAIGKYWGSKKTPNREILYLIFDLERTRPIAFPANIGKCVFRMHSNLIEKSLSFKASSLLGSNSTHFTNFIKSNGKFIEQLQFETRGSPLSNNESVYQLPLNYVPHILAHCPNLKTLKMAGFSLEKFDYIGIDLTKKIQLEELYFDGCVLKHGVLDQLSMIIPKIKHLYFACDSSPVEIIMSHSEINSITLSFNNRENSRVKVFETTEGVYHYYRCIEGVINTSSKEEYTDMVNDDVYIFISCKTIPKFNIEYYDMDD